MGDTVARPDAWCQRRARRSELSSAVGGGAGCRVAALGVDGGDATAVRTGDFTLSTVPVVLAFAVGIRGNSHEFPRILPITRCIIVIQINSPCFYSISL